MAEPIFFIELHEYTKSYLQSKLQYNDKEFFIFEKHLLEKSVIKTDTNHAIKFTFVGFIYFDETLILVLPKYMVDPVTTRFSKVRQLIQLFLKYSQNKTELTPDELETFGDARDAKQSNIFVLADFLMTDYAQNGLYITDESIKSINGIGEIEWNETIETLDMFLMNGTPFYPEFYTIDPYLDEEHIIYQIHQAVLNEISTFLRRFEILNIFHYEPLHFDISLEELGDIDYLLHCIEKEMQVEFSDRKIQLLNALKSYISTEKFESAQNQLKLFGTKTFHVVWEKVCSQVYANEYDRFKSYIPKPIWTELDTNLKAEESTLIPDILVHNEEEKAFFILDAKYYLTHFAQDQKNSFQVLHNPGIGDITKQYLYEQALRNKCELIKESECYNIFLMPTEEESHFFGHASIDIFSSEFKGIYLYRQNAESLYDKYLNNEYLDTASFKKFIDDHRNSSKTK